MLTTLGIVIGVAAVVCIAAAGEGAKNLVSASIRQLGTNVLYLTPGSEIGEVARSPQPKRHLTEDDARAIVTEINDVQIASPTIVKTGRLIVADKNWPTTIYGTNSDYLLARDWQLAAGRVFNGAELGSASKVAIIGQVISDKLFDGHAQVGDTFRIGPVPFTVVGILKKKGQATLGPDPDDAVMIPLSTARSRVAGNDERKQTSRHSVDVILLKLNESTNLSMVKSDVTELLRQRHLLRPDSKADFSVLDPVEVMSAQETSVASIANLIICAASISLFVGGITIMNTMLVSVTERTREIGLRMAVGARRRDIVIQFLVEAVVLAIVGGILGIALGVLAAGAIAHFGGWPVLISPGLIVIACSVSSLVGLCFGYYPAHRASRLDPMIALRFE